MVSLAKRGDDGSKERDIHHRACTAPLAQHFQAAAHFATKNADGEAASKLNLQRSYVGNLTKIKRLIERRTEYDCEDPFMIRPLKDEATADIKDRWGPADEALDLFKHHSMFSMKHILQFQKDSNKYAKDNEDLASADWMKKLLTNSCEPELLKRIDDAYADIKDPLEKGGIVYFKIALDEMFFMSDDVISALQDWLKVFAKEGLTKTVGENVAICTEECLAVAERLNEVNQLPTAAPLHLLEGLTQCSVGEFTGPLLL